MAEQVSRREFLNRLGVTVGGAAMGSAALGAAGYVAGRAQAEAAEPPKGKIPDTPYKMGT